MNKKISLADAVAKIEDGMTLMIGGFLAAGSPCRLIDALVASGKKDLCIISNDTAFVDRGLGKLVANGQVKKVIASHIGTNASTIEQYNAKTLDVEFVPQGTLAERIRCGGAGIGGFLTPTGLGTWVEEGKTKMEVDGITYLLERPLRAQIALIGASLCDEAGNLIYKGTTQNMNPLMATAADYVIVETEKLVKSGSFPIESVHTPGIFVDAIIS